MGDEDRSSFGARAGDALTAVGRLLAPIAKALGRVVLAAAKGLWSLIAGGARAVRKRAAGRGAAEAAPDGKADGNGPEGTR